MVVVIVSPAMVVVVFMVMAAVIMGMLVTVVIMVMPVAVMVAAFEGPVVEHFHACLPLSKTKEPCNHIPEPPRSPLLPGFIRGF
jgi:hypothetical protein